MKPLSLRALNRATLSRQLLLDRVKLTATAAVERLAGLQAQWAPSPYGALWSRLVGFEREHLWSAIQRRAVVRARLMRGTLHLVSARDFFHYAVATQDTQRGAWNRLQIGRGVDPGRVHDIAVAFAREPRLKGDVLAHVREQVKPAPLGPDGWLVWRFISAHADLITAPPGGHWEYGGTDAPYVAARHWIGRGQRPDQAAALQRLVLRYLSAYGPATMSDICKWAGQVPPRVRPVLEKMAPRLVRLKGEDGRAYFDVPRGDRPDEGAPAPVRFLPRYDEVLIGYAHRDRVMAEPYRPAVFAPNGIIEATFLVDGFGAGTWAVEMAKGAAVLRAKPFDKLSRADRAAVTEEAERLVRFAAPQARTYAVRVG